MTDPEVIRAFLTARYDEEEQAARDGLADPSVRRIYWVDDAGRQDSDVVPVGVAYWNRVLREVEAKRRRLARHAPSVWTSGDVRCADHEWEEWPCAEVIDDAQSWADHPDFPEELRLSD